MEDCYIHRTEYNNMEAFAELSQKIMEELELLETI